MAMQFRINETGEMKELSIRDRNGVDWIQDMIGNSGAVGDYIIYNDEDCVYEISEENFDWWEGYVENYKADEEALTELREELNEKHDSETVAAIFADELTSYGEGDYDRHHDLIREQIKNVREEWLS